MRGVGLSLKPTENRKLVPEGAFTLWFATYRSVGYTCSSSCGALGNGCYAETGRVSLVQRNRETNEIDRHSDNDGARYRDWFRKLPDGSTVRLHVSGDVNLPGGPDGNNALDLDYLRAIVETARERPTVRVFGYTHSWRLIDRTEWDFPRNLVINASCDTAEDIRDALELGWSIATIVSSETNWKRNGNTVICPNQTVGLTCSECNLCTRERNLIVAFRAHGNGSRKLNAKLQATP
jgi:hypothetical protein